MKKLFTLLTALTLVFAVAGCKDDTPTGPTDADLVAEATTALLLTNLNEVTSNLTLPNSGLHSSVVTWASSDTAVVTDAGVVTRPAVGEANAVITLTATITIGDESDTKDFTVRVISAVPTLAITIADMLEDTVESGEIVEVTATVVGIVVGAGVQLYDGTGFIYVYNGGGVQFGETPVAIGDKVVVTGAKGAYYGSPQITDVASITFVDGGNAVPAFVPTLIADLFAEDPYNTMYHSNAVTVTGVIELDGSDIYFIETDENNDAYRVLIYYKSDDAKMTELMALEGKMVSADLFTYGFHDGYNAWRATINSTAVITSADLTDAQRASYEIAMVDLGTLDALTDDLDLVATTNEGNALTWATSDAATITEAGVVTRVVGSDVTAVLTATVTVGTATVSRDFEVVVKDADYVPEGMPVADALETDDGDVLYVEGIVSAIIGSNTVLQDEDGTAIIIYNKYLVSDNNLALGDKIIVRGTKDTYYGVHQLGSVDVLAVVSTGNDVLVHTDLTVADIVGDIAGYQGHNFELTGLVVVELDDGFGYATLGDGAGNNVVLKLSSVPYAEALWAVDDLVDLSVVAWDVYYGNNRVYVYDYPELTDQEAVDYIAFDYYVPELTKVDIDLDTMDEDTGVAISWTSDVEATISTVGVVTQPEVGEMEVVVTLVATFTLNDATATMTYTVTVPALVEAFPVLFFSEIIEGSSNNKAIELYNPSSEEVDLSLYSIRENYGSGDNTLALTGMLAAGEVFVICTDQAGTEITAECDLALGYPSISHFNGDDSLQLIFEGTVIDQFMDEALAGTGDDAKAIYGEHTFVRNATVVEGVTVFDMNEWTVFEADDFTYIGSHTYTPAE